MPHIEIQCFSGRTEEQKKKCAERIADVVAETLGCKMSSVSVAIADVPEEEWKEKVWDKHVELVDNNKGVEYEHLAVYTKDGELVGGWWLGSW